jgi:hypothetical protein
MNDEERDEERMRGILGRSRPVAVPPFEAVARRRASRSGRRSVAVTLTTIVVAVAALYGGRELSLFRQQQASPTAGVAAPSATASPKVVLPQPIPQPITRTSAAAQVGWVITNLPDRSVSVGVDRTGKIVGTIDGATDPGRLWRSADGALLVAVTDDRITMYSALDGTKQRTYPRQLTGGVIDVAFSPDGRWLALILSTQVAVQVLDLQTGMSQTTPIASDANAATPGLSGTFSGPVWSTLVFAPDSKRLYAIVDWGGPLRITAFDVTATGLAQAATAVSGQGGRSFPSCAGPGLAARVLPGGKTMVAFCHMDGQLWLIDLTTLAAVADKATGQTNPFELSPIFTPDGQLVYLRGGTRISAFDVASRTLVGPVAPPRKLDDPGPFGWLFGQANAGYIASTIPLSPDGTKLYLSGGDGITVLRLPDLKPVAKLAPGLNLGEVWISGDGKTVYATDAGHGLYVIPEGGGDPITVTLPGQSGGYFIASEHG